MQKGRGGERKTHHASIIIKRHYLARLIWQALSPLAFSDWKRGRRPHSDTLIYGIWGAKERLEEIFVRSL